MADVRAYENGDEPVVKGSEEDWDNHIASANKSKKPNSGKVEKPSRKPKGKTIGDSTSKNSFVE